MKEKVKSFNPSDELTVSGQDGSKIPLGKLCILFLPVNIDVYFFPVLLNNCATDFWHMEKREHSTFYRSVCERMGQSSSYILLQ